MKKILIVSTVSRQFYLFEQGNIEVLKSLGYEVHAAANFSDENERLDSLEIVRHPFGIQRSPFSLRNLKAFKELLRIMKSESFDAVHCHSPMGGVLARLAARLAGIKTVLYTAHGFHFFKKAPLVNWVIYYPVERLLSYLSDVIITINNEDYRRAQTFGAKNVECIPGVGVETKKYSLQIMDQTEKRRELGIPIDSFVILSVGELNKNKNHEIILKSIAKINQPNIYYIICGQGTLLNRLRDMSKKLGIENQVKLLGYRNDMPEIYRVADMFAFPSKREGLGLSALEAMASGLPIVTSNVHGILDYSIDGITGYTCNPTDVNGFADAIKKIEEDSELRNKISIENINSVRRFDIAESKAKMKKIYREVLLNE